MEADLVIKNCSIVTASDVIPDQDLLIKDGKILFFGHKVLELVKTGDVIDAHGAYVTPGGVDTHVHLHQDNQPTGDTFETGTRSAIAGGTTTIVAFASQAKTDTSIKPVVEEYHRRATGNAYCDYSFHIILSKPNPEILNSELSQMVDDGLSSVKLYMTYEALRLNDREILDVMNACRHLGMTTMIHAENADLINFISDHLVAQKLTSPYSHVLSRPQLGEDEATYRAICLAEFMDIPILIVHMSAKQAVSHVRNAQTRLLPIHAETCPQYLYLRAESLRCHASSADDFEGAKCVCSPALREDPADLDAMWAGLANGTFTVVSSDHAPDKYDHPKGKKAGIDAEGVHDWRQIPNGLPGVETRLPLLFKGVLDGKITINRFVELNCSNPAKLYGIADRKGTIAPGMDADLVIWYPDSGEKAMEAFALTNSMLHHDIDYTPYEGMKFANWPRYTILRGKLVWDRDGDGLIGSMGYGKFLKRGKSTLSKPRDTSISKVIMRFPI